MTRSTSPTKKSPPTISKQSSSSSLGSSSSKKPASASTGFIAEQANLVQTVLKSYVEKTPTLLKLIDIYLAFVMSTGIILFVYVFLAGTFPYNSFLSGFIASVGTFILAANLRIQLNPSNDFKGLSPEA
ncbi:Dolichyl-diphosphooligosaccharide-protein glycosyltransferase subunit dad1 [Phlyctochytrium planicorne]|nr:Dolichyl-diphosphooligosaccharide-protein glycosyltransferase subunit dad1 [Phlyctochytrium planicorne]